MLAANSAVQRPVDAKLLVVDSQRNLIHVPRTAFVEFLQPNDLVIANDAATLPRVSAAYTSKLERGLKCDSPGVDR